MRLIDHFIPSRRNKFHPTGLRPLGLFLAIGLLVALPPLYNFASAGKVQVLGYATNISINDLYASTNSERAANGVGALNLNSTLNAAAYNKAQNMFANNYWAHNAPDGTTPWAFISGAGYDWQYAGENLAKNFDTSAGVVNGWMNSSAHRTVMLNSSYADVGFAVVNGTLLGEATTLVVAMYATPKAAPAPVAQQAAPESPQPAASSPEPSPVTTTETPSPAPASDTPATETPVKEAAPAVTDSTPTPTDTKGEVEGSFIALPLRTYQSLNWAQKASLFIVCVLGLLFILKHTAIWRQRRSGLRHVWLRAHPLSQAALLAAVAIVTLVSGTGVIL